MIAKRWLRTPLLALTVLGLAVGACGSGNDNADAKDTTTTSVDSMSSTTQAMAGAARIVTENDNGSTQTLVYNADSSEQGTLRINLQTAGGSGYTWKITKQPDAKVVTASTPTQEPTTPRPTSADGSPLVGAPETVSTLLTATGPGTTSIELSHIGPTGGAPDDTFTLTIVVS